MASAHVQTCEDALTGVTNSIAKAFASNVSAGNLIFVTVSWGAQGSGETCTLTDSLGNTWTTIGSRLWDATNNQSMQVFYAKNITGGACTLTATFSTARDFRRICGVEYSGLDTSSPLDKTAQAGSQAGTTATDNITTPSSGALASQPQLVVGTFITTDSSPVSAVAGTGYTGRSALLRINTEDKRVTATTAQTPTFTYGTSRAYHALVATFKEVAGGGNPTAGPYGTVAAIYDPIGADANPIGDGWTTNFTGAAHSDWRRLSNLLAPAFNGSSAQAYRAGATYGFDHEIWFQLPAKGVTNGHYLDIISMIADPNGASLDFYGVEIAVAAGADDWTLFRQFNTTGAFPITGGSGTPTATQEVTAGDWIALSVRDNGSGSPIIKGWYWDGAAWVEKVTYTDTSASKITVAGFFGLEATGNSAWRFAQINGGAIGGGGGGGGTNATRDLALLGAG